MAGTSGIREHMEVVDSDDIHIGTVDRVEGGRVKLTKSDPAAAGTHHFVEPDWIDEVDSKVHLNKRNAELLAMWKSK
jgi:hypothetical protein